MATKGHKHLNSLAADEHDPVEYRKRVATYIDGNTVSYEDTDFVSGDSPAVANVEEDLGRKGHKGYFVNEGPGDIKLEFSFDGTVYGGQHTLSGGDTLLLNDLNISKMRITHIDNTSYRCLVG